jgi:hypothetical protein
MLSGPFCCGGGAVFSSERDDLDCIVIARSVSDAAIQDTTHPQSGLPRCARNDDSGSREVITP